MPRDETVPGPDNEPASTAPPSPSPSVIKVLSKQAIYDAIDNQRELVEVPEWGGSVYVRSMSGDERDGFEDDLLVRRGKNVDINLRNIRARLVQQTVVDAEGTPLFTVGDLGWLGTKNAKALERVYKVAQRLSGITDEDAERIASDLGNVPSASSGSTSLVISGSPSKKPNGT